jgi:DNA-binding CsgD family transcriptional regulator
VAARTGPSSSFDDPVMLELAQRMRGPRGRPAAGWDSLTPTERLVAEHAATGATNAQIAEQLLVSVPTVKTHLTRIYTKLDITNRTQLANAVRRSPLQHDA